MLNLSVERVSLRLTETVRSSRGEINAVDTCMVTVTHAGIVAYGEGTPIEYDGVTADDVARAVEADGPALLGPDLTDPQAALERVDAWDAPAGARMALDGALHDWIGKVSRRPTWQILAASRRIGPTVYTIGIASPAEAATAVRNAPQVGAFKVKVGGPDDIDVLDAIRQVTPLPIRIDANEAWDLSTARALTPRLRALGVHLVEQPFPRSRIDDYVRYREVPDRLPIVLDEGCTDVASVHAALEHSDGIVVKLCKAGGVRAARRVMTAARQAGLTVLLSCMCESELAISQAALLAPLADHIDLDGHLYLRDQPFRGLGLEGGWIVLGDGPGLGVAPATNQKRSRR
ncbi:L-alanine-DL-glutamate epimerase [Micromonospora haikouensis]|uniref:L-alanine-DL-glutamate epimerase n=1 Tax=Micromonospora haikouensis TaxID=686309 RepID=A0A1C4YNN5_9ACTN|nr:enolase C-terminal domain-like protein [Micromonospora haikouensis]SCF22290.1 L-alanine-DL-glutamate epimerase [Micromonospora haikouensis]